MPSKKECTCKIHNVTCPLWEDDGLETRGLTENEDAEAIIEQMKKKKILQTSDANYRPFDPFEIQKQGSIINKIVNLKPVCECYREKYMELIFAVGKKYPGETRHQTALRYIKQANSEVPSSVSY